jgi:hypothetical protein
MTVIVTLGEESGKLHLPASPELSNVVTVGVALFVALYCVPTRIPYDAEGPA